MKMKNNNVKTNMTHKKEKKKQQCIIVGMKEIIMLEQILPSEWKIVANLISQTNMFK